jgi:catechol 2,3-dioxygenase-like lactoylglutathione lyase family enzyme
MRMNQATVTMPDLDAGWRFYTALGLVPVVDSRPRYARFRCPDGDSTLSLQQGPLSPGGTTLYFECDDLDVIVARLKAAGLAFGSGPEDKPWLWREADLCDPAGNRIVLFHAGENRLAPPWALPASTFGYTTPMNPTDDDLEREKRLERAMGVYGDTDMDPNRDDQKDMHHGEGDTVDEEEKPKP